MKKNDYRKKRREETEKLAAKILGGSKNARTWMRNKIPALNYQRPCDLIKTVSGTENVRNTLQQIKYGVYV